MLPFYPPVDQSLHGKLAVVFTVIGFSLMAYFFASRGSRSSSIAQELAIAILSSIFMGIGMLLLLEHGSDFAKIEKKKKKNNSKQVCYLLSSPLGCGFEFEFKKFWSESVLMVLRTFVLYSGHCHTFLYIFFSFFYILLTEIPNKNSISPPSFPTFPKKNRF